MELSGCSPASVKSGSCFRPVPRWNHPSQPVGRPEHVAVRHVVFLRLHRVVVVECPAVRRPRRFRLLVPHQRLGQRRRARTPDGGQRRPGRPDAHRLLLAEASQVERRLSRPRRGGSRGVVFLTTWQGGHRPRHSYFRSIVLFVCAQERSRRRGPDPNWVTSHDDLSRCRKRRREGVGRTKIGGRGSSRSDRAEPGVRPVRDAGCGT